MEQGVESLFIETCHSCGWSRSFVQYGEQLADGQWSRTCPKGHTANFGHSIRPLDD